MDKFDFEKFGLDPRPRENFFDLEVDVSIKIDDSLYTSTIRLLDIPNVISVLSKFGFCLVISPIK